MRTPSDSKTKPQGSAASWGTVKGVMSMSPMENCVPEWKYSTAGRSVGAAFCVAGEAQRSVFVRVDRQLERGVGVVGAMGCGFCSDAGDDLGLLCQLCSEVAVRSARGYGCGAGLFLPLHVIEPLRVGHRCTRGKHADPRAVGGFGQEDWNVEPAREDGEPGDVVLVLMGNENRIESRRIFASDGHTLEKFAAREAGVDQYARARAGDDGAIAFGAGGEHCHAHHSVRIR